MVFTKNLSTSTDIIKKLALQNPISFVLFATLSQGVKGTGSGSSLLQRKVFFFMTFWKSDVNKIVISLVY